MTFNWQVPSSNATPCGYKISDLFSSFSWSSLPADYWGQGRIQTWPRRRERSLHGSRDSRHLLSVNEVMGIPSLSRQLTAPASRMQFGDHPLEGNQTITAPNEFIDETPVQLAIGPHAQPLAATIRRLKESPILGHLMDIQRIRPKGNRRPQINKFKRDKCSFAGYKIGMPPGSSLGGFWQGKTQIAKPLQGLRCPWLILRIRLSLHQKDLTGNSKQTGRE